MNFDLKSFGKRLYEKINDDDILGNAAQVAFYFSFALFPLLLFLMTLTGIIISNKAEFQSQLFAILGEVMPKSAFDLVQKTLTEVTSNATGGKLTVGVLITLWSASAGVGIPSSRHRSMKCSWEAERSLSVEPCHFA